MKVNVALLQSRDYCSVGKNLHNALKQIEAAAAAGANIVCTQELFLSDYFCRVQHNAPFSLAEKIPSDHTFALQQAARKYELVIIASLFEEAIPGIYYNTAVIIDADGSYLGKYRKNHIPQDPFFEEKFYFTPGDLGYPVWKTKFGTVGVLLCWDQWYPEAARSLALKGAEIILVPTAIGWLPNEKDECGEAQCNAWKQVQKGHAVANSCFYAAVNRTGVEHPLEFWGQSFVCDYYGRDLCSASSDSEEILMAECNLEELKVHRQTWPFFRDRRIDTYADLDKRCIEESDG